MTWSRAFAVFPILLLSSIVFCAASAIAADSPSIVLEDDLVIGLDDESMPLGRIVDVAVDSKGCIYVLDTSAQAVHKYNSHGLYLTSVGGPGDGPGEFNAPRCLTIGGDDRLYVSGGDLSIEVFDAFGVPLDRIKRVTPSIAQSIAVDAAGDIYVVALNLLDQKMIHKYDGDSGERVRSFCDSYAVGGDVDTREEALFALGSVAVESDRVYYVQSYPHKIRTFDLSGELITEFDARLDESLPPRRRFDTDGAQYAVPASFSRTIIPLEGERILTILGQPFEGGDRGTSYLDLYGRMDGARIASVTNPPTVSLSCIDDRGRVYSAEARNEVPVVVRYRLKVASATGG